MFCVLCVEQFFCVYDGVENSFCEMGVFVCGLKKNRAPHILFRARGEKQKQTKIRTTEKKNKKKQKTKTNERKKRTNERKKREGTEQDERERERKRDSRESFLLFCCWHGGRLRDEWMLAKQKT